MTNSKTWLRSILPLALTLTAGCAPAYHSYSGCYVDCKYCTPSPLPYTHYEGCVCHSCAASNYLASHPQPSDDADERTNNDVESE